MIHRVHVRRIAAKDCTPQNYRSNTEEYAKYEPDL